MRRTSAWRGILLGPCLAWAAGCVGGSGGTSETSATGGVGGTGPDGVLGFQWCIQAANANGHWQDPPSLGQNIWAEGTSSWVRACTCYCPEDDITMGYGVIGGLIGEDLEWYNAQVSVLQGLAEAACLARVAELEMQHSDELLFTLQHEEDCATAVSDEIPFFGTECVKHTNDCETDLPVQGTDGMADGGGGEDGGAFVYGLTDYDDVIQVRRTYTEIDIDFVENILADLSVFEDDNIGVVLSRSSQGCDASGGNCSYGFELQTVGSNSLPAALGFVQGDIVLTVNGDSLASVADVTAAFESHHQENDFAVTLDRSGRLVTKNFVFTDMTTYP